MNKDEGLIKLQFEDGEKEFLDTDELRNFLESQRNSWTWLEETASEDKNLDEVWEVYNNYLCQIDHFLNTYQEYEHDGGQQHKLKEDLLDETEYASSHGIVLSESPKAKFVEALKERTNPKVAAYALAFLMELYIDFHQKSALEGSYWALQFLQGNTDTVQAQQDSLKSMKQDWNTRFGKQHENLREQNKELIIEVTELKSQYYSLVESSKEQIEKAEKQLKDIERTYNEKLALQSSVQYWSNKCAHHQKIMFWTGGVTLLLALATTGAFIWVALELLEETVAKVPLWKLSIMLAISSFGVWVTRLAAKIFISNLHLRTDSHERTTMIQTYLALLREGTGPKDEERQLILQTLFRPSTTGFIKEDGPASFYETISKAFGK